MVYLPLVIEAVELQGVIDDALASTAANALCLGLEAPATVAAQDQLDTALDAQLLTMYLADNDWDY